MPEGAAGFMNLPSCFAKFAAGLQDSWAKKKLRGGGALYSEPQSTADLQCRCPEVPGGGRGGGGVPAGVFLSSWLHQSSARSNVFVFVMLSSLLLLLHQDAYLFNTFNPDKQRYVPPLVNVETLLGMIALVELYSEYFAVWRREAGAVAGEVLQDFAQCYGNTRAAQSSAAGACGFCFPVAPKRGSLRSPHTLVHGTRQLCLATAMFGTLTAAFRRPFSHGSPPFLCFDNATVDAPATGRGSACGWHLQSASRVWFTPVAVPLPAAPFPLTGLRHIWKVPKGLVAPFLALYNRPRLSGDRDLSRGGGRSEAKNTVWVPKIDLQFWAPLISFIFSPETKFLDVGGWVG